MHNSLEFAFPRKFPRLAASLFLRDVIASLTFTARTYADESGATVPLEASGPIMKRATIPGAPRAIGLFIPGPTIDR